MKMLPVFILGFAAGVLLTSIDNDRHRQVRFIFVPMPEQYHQVEPDWKENQNPRISI